MDLLRHWRRRTFGAAAGAVIAPAAIVAAALAIGIGAGGVGGLRSIGQAFNGPDLPAVSAPRAPGSAGKLLSRVGRRNRPLPAPGPGTPAGVQVAAAPNPAPAAPPAGGGTPNTPARTPPQPTTPGLEGGGSPNPRPAPPSAATPAATPVPTQAPSLVRQVGDGVKSVTDQVPVAGKPVGDVVDLLVNTVDGLTPPR